MFEYNICNEPDADIFERQCHALEKNIPDIIKMELLQDVDGSMTQLYEHDKKSVQVHNSHYFGAIFVKSEEDLTKYFTV